MPESYQTQDKIAKLQKDVQELKEHMEDDWHERRDVYIGRVEKALRKDMRLLLMKTNC